jgi:hypothetical protein
MKNYERYPELASKGNHIDFCMDFWKDHPDINKESVTLLFRQQWAIIMYGNWWVCERPREDYLKLPIGK